MATYTTSDATVRAARELPQWQVRDGQLVRVFETKGWTRSIQLANAIGHLAECADHHPDLLVTWPRLEVRLVTHDAGGITGKDFALAAKIEEVAGWKPA
jgi:4a-hydroxytetrahydrobiopterin dehydratase